MKLIDVADISVGYPFKSKDFNEEGKGIRLVRGKNVTKRALRWESDTRWWEQIDSSLDSYLLKAGDIVLGMDGSLVGKNFARIREEDLPLYLVQRVACIRAKEPEIQEFLWQSIASERFSAYIDSIKTGTSIPHISGKQIGEYDLPDLSVDTMEKIGSILESIEGKVNINNKINRNLLEQALAIYHKMFVETGNDERTTCRTDEFFDITIGKTPPRKEKEWFSDNPEDCVWISISDMGSCGTFITDSSEYLTKAAVDKHNVKVVPDNTVILSFKLTVGRIAITVGETTTNEAIAHFNTSKDNITEYLYCYLKSFDFGSLGSTSSIGTAVNSKTIKAMDFVIPGESELQEFCDIARPMFEQIKKNQFENQNLITMRDSLLPKLMSGELDVSDLDI